MTKTQTKQKPSSAPEAKKGSDKLEIQGVDIQWDKFDLTQFRKGLSAELADGSSKAATSCVSSDPKLIDKVLRTHLTESAEQAALRLQTKEVPKHDDSQRAINQAHATAFYRNVS